VAALRQRLLERRDSGEWIQGAGTVARLLGDDHDGSRHQRFVPDMRNRQTLLIAHNIDLAARIPIGMGDKISFRGMYEWNDLGGLVHWTHHDPMGMHEGGYIEFRSQRYRWMSGSNFS
jgi:hypothetical protein